MINFLRNCKKMLLNDSTAYFTSANTKSKTDEMKYKIINIYNIYFVRK